MNLLIYPWVETMLRPPQTPIRSTRPANHSIYSNYLRLVRAHSVIDSLQSLQAFVNPRLRTLAETLLVQSVHCTADNEHFKALNIKCHKKVFACHHLPRTSKWVQSGAVGSALHTREQNSHPNRTPKVIKSVVDSFYTRLRSWLDV